MLPDIVDNCIAYENGQLDTQQTLDFFANLIRTGLAWELQGHYGRVAKQLIADGWISKQGQVVRLPWEED